MYDYAKKVLAGLRDAALAALAIAKTIVVERAQGTPIVVERMRVFRKTRTFTFGDDEYTCRAGWHADAKPYWRYGGRISARRAREGAGGRGRGEEKVGHMRAPTMRLIGDAT